MPRALYPPTKNLHYGTATSRGDWTPENEVKEFVLCGECEKRFNVRGESHVLSLLAAKALPEFPFLESVRAAVRLREIGSGREVYGMTSLRMKPEKWAYFTLSVVWRAAIHDWLLPTGNRLPRLDLGRHEEWIREYLLEHASFPLATAVLLAVCSDPDSREIWSIPDLGVGDGFATVRFQALGFVFVTYLGPQIPQLARELCCAISPEHPLILADCSRLTQRVLDGLAPL